MIISNGVLQDSSVEQTPGSSGPRPGLMTELPSLFLLGAEQEASD